VGLFCKKLGLGGKFKHTGPRRGGTPRLCFGDSLAAQNQRRARNLLKSRDGLIPGGRDIPNRIPARKKGISLGVRVNTGAMIAKKADADNRMARRAGSLSRLLSGFKRTVIL